jgi:hypothetical protein
LFIFQYRNDVYAQSVFGLDGTDWVLLSIRWAFGCIELKLHAFGSLYTLRLFLFPYGAVKYVSQAFLHVLTTKVSG